MKNSPENSTSNRGARLRHIVCWCVCLIFGAGVGWSQTVATNAAPATTPTITAKSFREKIMANNSLAKATGETFAWASTYEIVGFFHGYYAYQDKSWLEEASTFIDYQISRLETEPDGFKGWVGIHYGIKGQEASVVIGDALICKYMLMFSEIVLKDEALKKSPLGKKAEEYVALAKSILVDKWDKRGGYYEDGMFMSYLSTGWVVDRKENKAVEFPDKKWSENLNKHATMGSCFLKLYRITGEKMYKERAEKIFGHYKAIFRYHKDEDRYFWNFWEPLAPFDFKPEGDNAKSWIAVHPCQPGYQVGECEEIVEAYHTGVVFSEDDMKKLVNNNLWMWNKSLTDIHFKSADGTEIIAKNYPRAGQDAGALFPSLVYFDPQLRSVQAVLLSRASGMANQIEKDYFEKVVCKQEPSYKRKYVTGKVTLPDITVCPSREIIMAVAIPAHIDTSKGEEMRLACKVNVKGPVKVSLVSEDGKQLIYEIGEIPISPYKDMYGVSSIRWNGKDKDGKAYQGNYRVRFTLNDSTREWKIKLTD